MRAVVVTPEAGPHGLAIRDVEEPTILLSEALVRVEAFSLNSGEVRGARRGKPGNRPGWDLAGVVERAAVDGSSPPEGARVVGFLERGSWAERVTVPGRSLAVIPDQVSTEVAACLPCAGLTALHGLAKGGLLLGRRVLVNGASGGVGGLACQLSRAAGAAMIVGVVRRPEAEHQVREDGAHAVVVADENDGFPEAETFGPFDLILESVGGGAVGQALRLLAPDGTCVSFGLSSEQPATIDPRPFFLLGGARLYGMNIYDEARRHPPKVGLTHLLELAVAGSLKPRIAREAGWDELGGVAEDVFERRLAGKAVIRVN